MKKSYLILIFCFYLILTGCAGKDNGTSLSRTTLENPLQIPIHGQNNSIYIKSEGILSAKDNIGSILLDILEDKYSMHATDNAFNADYIIQLDIDNFAQVQSTTTGEYIWQMSVDVNIEDMQKENFTSRIIAETSGKNMSYSEAALKLQNKIALALSQAFIVF